MTNIETYHIAKETDGHTIIYRERAGFGFTRGSPRCKEWKTERAAIKALKKAAAKYYFPSDIAVIESKNAIYDLETAFMYPSKVNRLFVFRTENGRIDSKVNVAFEMNPTAITFARHKIRKLETGLAALRGELFSSWPRRENLENFLINLLVDETKKETISIRPDLVELLESIRKAKIEIAEAGLELEALLNGKNVVI